MSKNPRIQNVQTPGVEVSEAEDATANEPVEQPGIAPDIAELVAREVAKQVRKQAAPAASTKQLPTQAEALAVVKADPKHRSVLSVDGWVTHTAPPKERDEAGFAKA